MAITTNDGYVASAKQSLQWAKLASRVAVAAGWHSIFDLTGQPGFGTMNVGNTANGIVPTDASAGYPSINAFGAGATGYVSAIDFGSSVACRIAVFDRVFACGAHAFNAATTLTAIPSYAGRIPGTDYTGCQLWLEQVTLATGIQNVAVGYTNQAGTAGKTTGTFATAANAVGRCFQLPLQAGDTGVSIVNSVTGSVATVGTFNINVLRPLWTGRVRIANDGDVHNYLKTGLPQIFADSAIYVLIAPDSTATGIPELSIEVANG